MISFIDRDGDTVYLTKEQVAACLKDMMNPPGWYILVPNTNDMQKVGGNTAVMIRASEMPKYSWFARFSKKWKWDKEQKRIVENLRKNNPMNLIINPEPFVLKMPWLQLKRNECHAIYVT